MARGIFAICVSAVMGAALIFIVTGEVLWHLGGKLPDLAVPAGVTALAAVMGTRMYRLGLYHNDYGVRIQYLIRHRVVPWSSIAAIESRSIPLPSKRQIRVIVLTTVEGAEIVTPLGCVSGGNWPRGYNFTAEQNLSPDNFTRALSILQRGLPRPARRLSDGTGRSLP